MGSGSNSLSFFLSLIPTLVLKAAAEIFSDQLALKPPVQTAWQPAQGDDHADSDDIHLRTLIKSIGSPDARGLNSRVAASLLDGHSSPIRNGSNKILRKVESSRACG